MSNSLLASLPLFYAVPLLSAFIGWLTNYLAIKLLFRPRRRVRLLFFSFQGLFPKRQKAIAHKVANLVVSLLVSEADLKKRLLENKAIDRELLELIEKRLDEGLRSRVKKELPLLAMFVPVEFSQKIKAALMEEIKSFLPAVKERMGRALAEGSVLETLIRERIESFSSLELEKLLLELVRKEFRFIEISGAVLGFLIGILQLLLIRL